MSEKKAKEERRKQKNVQLAAMITAKIYSDGSVGVGGFSLNFKEAMFQAHLITKAIAGYFVKAAQEGRLENGVAEQPRIVLPKGISN